MSVSFAHTTTFFCRLFFSSFHLSFSFHLVSFHNIYTYIQTLDKRLTAATNEKWNVYIVNIYEEFNFITKSMCCIELGSNHLVKFFWKREKNINTKKYNIHTPENDTLIQYEKRKKFESNKKKIVLWCKLNDFAVVLCDPMVCVRLNISSFLCDWKSLFCLFSDS